MITRKTNRVNILIMFIILAIAGCASYLYLGRNKSNDASKEDSPVRSGPLISFSGAEGWSQGPSNGASMALFGPKLEDGTSSCFTSAEYYSGSVDPTLKLKASRNDISGFGREVATLGYERLSINIDSSIEEYDLHKFDIKAPSSNERIMGGHAIAYLNVKDGHLKIYANCNKSEQLDTAIPALRAYSVDLTNK